HCSRPLGVWCGELLEVVAASAHRQGVMDGESVWRALCRFESGVIGGFDAMLGVAGGPSVPRFQVTGGTGEIVVDGREVTLYDAYGTGRVVGESGYME